MQKKIRLSRHEKKITCLMVFGGNSDEHFVSVHTAITFIRYLWDSPVISIQPFYISRTGNYYLIDRSELIKISDSFFFNEEIPGKMGRSIIFFVYWDRKLSGLELLFLPFCLIRYFRRLFLSTLDFAHYHITSRVHRTPQVKWLSILRIE